MVVLNPQIVAEFDRLVKTKILTDKEVSTSLGYLFCIYMGYLYETPGERLWDILVMNGLVRTNKESYELGIPLFSTETPKVETPTHIPSSNKITRHTVRSIVENRIIEYMSVFCKDVKVNKNGKPIFYGLKAGSQGDKKSCVKKLIRWFKENNYYYTMDDVINTAKMYVYSCREERYKFLQAADYFISKDGSSRLTKLIDEFKDKKVPTIEDAKNTLDI